MGDEVGIRIRLDRELRDRFVASCRAGDQTASQVLRDFMRRYVAGRGQSNEQRTERSNVE